MVCWHLCHVGAGTQPGHIPAKLLEPVLLCSLGTTRPIWRFLLPRPLPNQGVPAPKQAASLKEVFGFVFFSSYPNCHHTVEVVKKDASEKLILRCLSSLLPEYKGWE